MKVIQLIQSMLAGINKSHYFCSVLSCSSGRLIARHEALDGHRGHFR